MSDEDTALEALRIQTEASIEVARANAAATEAKWESIKSMVIWSVFWTMLLGSSVIGALNL